MSDPAFPRAAATLLVAIDSSRRGAVDAAVVAIRAAGVGRVAAEEVLLQAVLFFGFPRVIRAFAWFDEAWPATPADLAARPDAVAIERQGPAGREMFEGVYGRHTERVLEMLRGHHPDLASFVLEAAYGRVLSRGGISAVERELVACAALGILGQERQLTSHALGAQRFGATREQVLDVVAAVEVDDAVLERLAEHLA